MKEAEALVFEVKAYTCGKGNWNMLYQFHASKSSETEILHRKHQ